MSSDLFSQPEFELFDSDTKEWIDARSSFLLYQFGPQRVRLCPVILPTTEFFPRQFAETKEDACELLDRLCEFLQIDPQTVQLEVYRGGQRADGGMTPLGVYQQHDDHFRIWVEGSQLDEPLELAATMIHELCHIHLLGHGRITEDFDDHEPLTDLATVFLGLGVITANATLRDVSWRGGGLEGWHINTRGYLTMQMYGYALALFSRVRGEDTPMWSKHLRPDVRHAFQKSLLYFEQNGLPEMRSVRTTTARPCTIGDDSPDDDSQWPPPSDSDTATEACTFCGQVLPDQDPADGVCKKCQESIEENRAQIEAEEQAVAAAHQRSRTIIRGGLVLFLLLILVLAALDYLDFLE
jgi:hypothetical protein